MNSAGIETSKNRLRTRFADRKGCGKSFWQHVFRPERPVLSAQVGDGAAVAGLGCSSKQESRPVRADQTNEPSLQAGIQRAIIVPRPPTVAPSPTWADRTGLSGRKTCCQKDLPHPWASTHHDDLRSRRIDRPFHPYACFARQADRTAQRDSFRSFDRCGCGRANLARCHLETLGVETGQRMDRRRLL